MNEHIGKHGTISTNEWNNKRNGIARQTLLTNSNQVENGRKRKKFPRLFRIDDFEYTFRRMRQKMETEAIYLIFLMQSMAGTHTQTKNHARTRARYRYCDRMLVRSILLSGKLFDVISCPLIETFDSKLIRFSIRPLSTSLALFLSRARARSLSVRVSNLNFSVVSNRANELSTGRSTNWNSLRKMQQHVKISWCARNQWKMWRNIEEDPFFVNRYFAIGLDDGQRWWRCIALPLRAPHNRNFRWKTLTNLVFGGIKSIWAAAVFGDSLHLVHRTSATIRSAKVFSPRAQPGQNMGHRVHTLHARTYVILCSAIYFAIWPRSVHRLQHNKCNTKMDYGRARRKSGPYANVFINLIFASKLLLCTQGTTCAQQPVKATK